MPGVAGHPMRFLATLPQELRHSFDNGSIAADWLTLCTLPQIAEVVSNARRWESWASLIGVDNDDAANLVILPSARSCPGYH
ncbi:hypothetical protein [Bradyrhizobium sp. 33ap4]|uniref:hypothetical protein n=1 Tax=Bradyrhizobium sp. 33ap4 TaxID=3061630 RepID=UPI00292CE8B4|nr:hypothetical protein [Bradyrhizobium sp. 33ap4]